MQLSFAVLNLSLTPYVGVAGGKKPIFLASQNFILALLSFSLESKTLTLGGMRHTT